jgi:hypothetical protein
MSVYVFALVDRPPSGRPGTGLTGPLSVRRVAGAFAIVERRGDVPPPEFGTLQRHHAVVSDLASRVPAILPVRFGTLVDADVLDEILSEREEDLEEAFEVVRGRVQFTWRRGSKGFRGSKVSRGSRGSDEMSGGEYLRRAAGRGRPPAAWSGLRKGLARFVGAERYQPATPSLPESLYHLVDRSAAREYEAAAAALRRSPSSPALSGPFPPFAFAREIL